VVVIVAKYLAERFVLCVVDGFDDVFEVAGIVEETAGFSWRPKFGKDVSAGKRDEVVGRVEVEVCS